MSKGRRRHKEAKGKAPEMIKLEIPLEEKQKLEEVPLHEAIRLGFLNLTRQHEETGRQLSVMAMLLKNYLPQ